MARAWEGEAGQQLDTEKSIREWKGMGEGGKYQVGEFSGRDQASPNVSFHIFRHNFHLTDTVISWISVIEESYMANISSSFLSSDPFSINFFVSMLFLP